MFLLVAVRFGLKGAGGIVAFRRGGDPQERSGLVTAAGYTATFLIGGYWVMDSNGIVAEPLPFFNGPGLTAGLLVTFLGYSRRFVYPMRQMGQIINAAFRFTGNFGGVVYRMETEDGTHPNWLVNPLVAEESVREDGLGVPVDSVETYKELWERVYFGNELLDTLVGIVGQDVTESVACPLCGISVTGKCHPDGCPNAAKVKTVREHKQRIVRALEDAAKTSK
jgi:hypothetical protein